MKNLKARVEKHPSRKTPQRIYDIQTKSTKEKPRKIATTVLKRIAPELKIKPDLSQLKFDQVKESILGKHVLFQQQHEGKPISGAWVRVDIDKEGKVYNIQNDLIPDPLLQKAKKIEAAKTASPQLTAELAKTRAFDALKPATIVADDVPEPEHEYYPHNDIATLVWKVIVKTIRPKGEWKIYVDAATGQILEKIDLLKSATGQGRVFDPNPVVVLNDTSLKDNSKIPDAAYSNIVLRDLKNTGMLDGPYVSTKRTKKRVKKTDLKFLFTRKDRSFKEVMVYFHIDRIQRYIQDLGFNNVLNKPIEVSIDGQSDDNSHYSPTDKSLTFGTGGVDDAEDAEIILHEYGHAVQDDQVPNFGSSKECGAMGEGFGDYLAASFFADDKPAKFKPTIGSWDAVAYSGAEPPCLRRLDSNKKYPKDLTGEVHDDGEIWSACLWEIRAAIGGRMADQLIIAHHFLLTPRSGFENAANALITADKNLNKGKNGKMIHDVFVRRGILPNQKRRNKRAGVRFEDTNGKNKK
jgi:Zn-dependent metalloprotease